MRFHPRHYWAVAVAADKSAGEGEIAVEGIRKRRLDITFRRRVSVTDGARPNPKIPEKFAKGSRSDRLAVAILTPDRVLGFCQFSDEFRAGEFSALLCWKIFEDVADIRQKADL